MTETVPAFWTVEHLDIVEYVLPCLFTRAIRLAPDSFPLEQLKAALYNGVVMAVSTPAHALLQVVLVQEFFLTPVSCDLFYYGVFFTGHQHASLLDFPQRHPYRMRKLSTEVA